MSKFIVYTTDDNSMASLIAMVSSEEEAINVVKETNSWEEKKGYKTTKIQYTEIEPNVNYMTESEDGPIVL